MSEHGGSTGDTPRKSRLADYAERTRPPAREPSIFPHATEHGSPETVSSEGREPAPAQSPPPSDPGTVARRRHFAELLGEFRRAAVLVPLADGPGPDAERGLLTVDFNGVRFILAFSDEQALARYAVVCREAARSWTYQTVLGARLLDVAVPAAGVPCGVALDCADGPDGVVFPPVVGIVPDEAAVDREEDPSHGR